WIARPQHELVEDRPLGRAALHVGRAAEILVQQGAAGEHFGELKTAPTQLGDEATERAVSDAGEWRAHEVRGKREGPDAEQGLQGSRFGGCWPAQRRPKAQFLPGLIGPRVLVSNTFPGHDLSWCPPTRDSPRRVGSRCPRGSWLVRCFVAVDVPEATRDAIAAAQGRLREAGPRADVGWVDARKLHLTLKFLGEVPEPTVDVIRDALAVIARRHEPFAL